MLNKPFTITKNLEGFAPLLERFLNDVARSHLQTAHGTYIGNGIEQTIATPFTPQIAFVYDPVMIVAIEVNIDPRGYFRDNQEVRFTNKGLLITAGSASVNLASIEYTFMVLG